MHSCWLSVWVPCLSRLTEPWLGMIIVFLLRASALDIAHCRKQVRANEMQTPVSVAQCYFRQL